MSRYLTAYVTSLLTFAVLDFGWLSLMTSRLYQPDLGPLLLAKPDMAAGVLFYLLYMVGLTAFVVQPGLEKRKWSMALTRGILFGLVAYGTYDLTNLATLKDFTLRLTIADMAWGATVSALAACAGYQVSHRIG